MILSLHNAATPPRRNARIVVWLALCLLFAQWLGYSHAIAHAGTKAETLISQADLSGASISSFGHQAAGNVCAALDAAALGASLHSPAFVPLLAVLSEAIADTPLPAGWRQPFTALFSSRAPPSHH